MSELEDKAVTIQKQIQDIGSKINQINELLGIIQFKITFQGVTLEWPKELEQQVFENYLAARDELIALVQALEK